MAKQQIGMVGLGVMGTNLALNIESHGYSVAVFERIKERTNDFMKNEANGRNIKAAGTLQELVDALESPRKIWLMVKAGKPTDATIAQLKPLLQPEDILIDGGNTFFKETIRRNKELSEAGIHFIGTGVSGGGEGALKGPALMPGGQKEAYDLVAPILKAVSAKVNGEPCCTYIGADGAGHFVKMVHNGIEYGDMQLISEAWFILKHILNLSTKELHDVFTEWNEGELDSYLIEITKDIFTRKDDKTGKPLVDMILDTAGQKGTGKWASENALDLGVPLPLITESVFARFISAMKEERVQASKVLNGPELNPFDGHRDRYIENVRQALYLAKIISYAQGFAQMRAASREYGWDLQYGRIAAIFRGGCIIRAQFLQKITDAFNRNSDLANLLLDPYFKEIADVYQHSLRRVVSIAVTDGIPVPAFSSAIAYYDSYRRAELPANLIQAQRDYFGAHTYQRVDEEGIFHTDWTARQ